MSSTSVMSRTHRYLIWAGPPLLLVGMIGVWLAVQARGDGEHLVAYRENGVDRASMTMDLAMTAADEAVDFEIVRPIEPEGFKIVSVDVVVRPERGPQHIVVGLAGTAPGNAERVIVVQAGEHTDIPLHPSLLLELNISGVEVWETPERSLEVEGRVFFQFIARTPSHQFQLAFEQDSAPDAKLLASVVTAIVGQ